MRVGLTPILLRLLSATCALLACTTTAGAAPVQPRQSDASYVAAVRNQSTAPAYVRVTVVDGNTGVARPICVTVNLLMGAIHWENELANDREGWTTGLYIALANKDHVFTFTKKKALDNIPRYYSDADLAQVRAATQGMSVKEILAALSYGGSLDQLSHGGGGWERHSAIRDATACVLIERGASPGMGDVTDQLWVRGEPTDPP